jgi:ubiquinone/menaquinone biosynthesis C-methylase UbiE
MRMDYDTASGPYARYRRVNPKLFERLAQLCRLDAQSRVLEVGSGSGNYISAIAEVRGCQCYGLEPSEGMLANAKARGGAISWTRGSAEILPYTKGFFDLLFCVDVIHHVTGIESFIREAFRVLRSGGVLCIATDSEWTIRKRNPLSVYFPETVEKELARYPSIELLQSAMRREGFSAVEQEIVEMPYLLENPDAYREKAFSCLHLISEEAHTRGMVALCEDLSRGPLHCIVRNALVYATKTPGSVPPAAGAPGAPPSGAAGL